MSGNIDIVTLLALLVTVVVVIKLRGALGRRTSDEDNARYERQARAREAREQAAANGDKVVTLPTRQNGDNDMAGQYEEPERSAEDRAQVKSADGNAAESGILAIAERDKSFDAEHFVSGAKQAYEMIVTAFAEGNRDMLADLLSEDVFDGFEQAISDREERGEIIDQSFVGINKCHIVEADLNGSEAAITLKFVSQLITATRSQSGEVLSGDPKSIQDVTDIWTFARDLDDPNPNWRLVATQASN